MTDEQTQPNRAEITREKLLSAALDVFGRYGFDGTSTRQLSEAAGVNLQAIPYYFGSKEGLYLAVLERAYQKIRSLETRLELEDLSPEDAMRTLIGSTFDHDDANPDFIQLVSIENIHRAEHLRNTDVLQKANSGIIAILAAILERGYREGVFARRIDPVDLHQMISALCFFRVSNRHTFGVIFGRDLMEDALKARHRLIISDMVLSYLKC